jgi:hypothetical protein
MIHAAMRSYCMAAAVAFGSIAVAGVDPPDVRINGMTGLIETVDATWSGTNYNVRYTVLDGAGQLASSQLVSTNPADDLDPRIVISGVGNAYVVWWRDVSTDLVVYRKRSVTTGAWTSERTVGLTTETNSRPRIVYAGDKAWVAYQIQSMKSRSVGAQVIDDDPEPMRSIVGTTSYNGNLDIQLQYEVGHLWVTWIDTSSRVAYAQYDYSRRAWSVVGYESYAMDSIAAARSRIRAAVLFF